MEPHPRRTRPHPLHLWLSLGLTSQDLTASVLHDAEFARPDPRKFVEETFLSPSAVRYYFDTWEPHDLNVLIGLAPDPVLAEHAERLVEMWPPLPHRAALDAAAFLARHDDVRAASLFEDYLSAPDTVCPRQVVGILQ